MEVVLKAFSFVSVVSCQQPLVPERGPTKVYASMI